MKRKETPSAPRFDGMKEHTLSLKKEGYKVVALAGNPNVGKSSVFNNLTGLRQHTGNWAGKTVSNATGYYKKDDKKYAIVDLPGCYSLYPHSLEESVARNFICFGGADCVIVICDATCLERNLILALQTIEVQENVVLCLNMIDEARKKHIEIDTEELSLLLGVPVVECSARKNIGLDTLIETVENTFSQSKKEKLIIDYGEIAEKAIAHLTEPLSKICKGSLPPRWLAIKLLEDSDTQLVEYSSDYIGFDIYSSHEVMIALNEAIEILKKEGITIPEFRDIISSCTVRYAEKIAQSSVKNKKPDADRRDRILDKIFSGKALGFPFMLLLLAIVFWLTIAGANYPSRLLASGAGWLEQKLLFLAIRAKFPVFIYEALIFGVYRTVAWVVSVMFPPMAIFFPLFTLLEDFGYLPRVAFNLDKCFSKCNACGKQGLTMCMGFGCNAAAVVGTRIIDSPRERLIAILTNTFVPCNGRFPMMIAVISMFFVAGAGLGGTVLSALALALIIVVGIAVTFFVSYLLSKTVLKGIPSSITLELPPYRKPQLLKVIVRSLFDRTVFVLGRAIMIAAPAGLIIYLLANVTIGDASILQYVTDFLDPVGKIIGLDGVILAAFFLGLPANEIVLPLIFMAYAQNSTLAEIGSLAQIKDLFMQNGWTHITAICVILFSLLHFPCSTTLLTVKKETGSVKWTAAAFLIPLATAFAVCFIVNLLGLLF